MDAIKPDDADIFVTLVEAAEDIDSSPDVLRRAIKGNELRAIRENPANTRSRWLVALADVRKLYGAEEPGEPSLAPVETSAVPPDPTDLHEEPTPVPTASDHSGTLDEAEVLQIVQPTEEQPNPAPEASTTLVEHPSPDESLASPAISRGEELVERFTLAIDRLADNLPSAPFDYQALLDKYVAAVERAAEAEVEAATLKRKIDDLNDQLATTLDRLDNAHAENRRLLVELDNAHSDLTSALDRGAEQEDKPLWKRRNR